MKNSIVVLIIFSAVIFGHSAHATMINYYDFKGTFETANIGNLETYSLKFNGDYPATLGHFINLNEFVKIQPTFQTSIWTEMLQRSFNPTPAELMQRTTIAEAWSNYGGGEGFIYGHLEFNGDIFYTVSPYFIRPIPDLSEYLINDLYTDSFIVQNGSTVIYNISLWADVSPDVSPVPEPSTFILLGIGVVVIGVLRRRGMNKTGLSLA